jgi:hypothetical protein
MEQTNWRCVRQKVGEVLINAVTGEVKSWYSRCPVMRAGNLKTSS